MNARPRRIVVRVTHHRRGSPAAPHLRWRVRCPAPYVDRWYASQAAAVERAVMDARFLKIGSLHPAQVILHGKSGRVRWERTYGDDPKRHRG